MFVVFVATLARPAIDEAEPLATSLGSSPYEIRLALAAGPPSILLITPERDRANDALAAIRARSHTAHVFDEETFVPSASMNRLDDFFFEPEGVRRTATEELLPFGDVFAILRAIHETTIDGNEDREHIAYFFRRSGDKPWILRERHATYRGLGEERTAVAFANFTRTLQRMRSQSAMAVYDDRLARRRVARRASPLGGRTSRDGMDLLAHLLAMTIASQGGSPYR